MIRLVAFLLVVLALVGAGFQDVKKREAVPGWRYWTERTSFVPFASILRGRARPGGFGGHALGGGVVLWLAATWAGVRKSSCSVSIDRRITSRRAPRSSIRAMRWLNSITAAG